MSSLVNQSDETNEPKDINLYAPAVSNLSKGILQIYSPPMVTIEKQLKELTTKQDFLIKQIHDENLTLAEARHSPELKEMFDKLKLYNTKLLNVKKDMRQVYERSAKLKKRAQRLQLVKEKEKQSRIKSEMQLKREENLIGKPSGSSAV